MQKCQSPSRGRRAGDQREHEGRLRQLELGVVTAALGRFHAKERAEELDRPVEAADCQGEVELAQRLVDGSHRLALHLKNVEVRPYSA